MMKLTLFSFPFGPCFSLQVVILEAVVDSHAFPPFSPQFPAVRTKMVYCKIDQTQRKVVVR